MLSVKQGGIKYHFLSLWYDSTWDWTQVSRAIGEPNQTELIITNNGWYAIKPNQTELIINQSHYRWFSFTLKRTGVNKFVQL